MSKNITAEAGGQGSPYTPQKKSNGHYQKQKKPFKSNITDRVKSKTYAHTEEVDVESDGDGDASSESEDAADSEDEEDVFALSDARQPRKQGAVRGPAGHDTDDDEMIDDDDMANAAQATTVAESNDGGDDDYADVEDVSDSEPELDANSDLGDEDAVLRHAEQDLMQEFQETEEHRNEELLAVELDEIDLAPIAENPFDVAARQLGLDQYGFLETPELSRALDMDLNGDPFYGFGPESNEYTGMRDQAESRMWRIPESARRVEGGGPMTTTKKHVRFEETPESISEDEDEEEEDPVEYFPDLLTSADDPAIRQHLSQPSHDGIIGLDFLGDDLMDNDSVYDFEDPYEKMAFEADESDSSEHSEDEESSDDYDDETDEETPEEQLARQQARKAAIRKAAAAQPVTPKSEKRPTLKLKVSSTAPSTPRPVTPGTSRGPRTGRFELDPSRASIHHDSVAGKLTIEPPTQPLEKDKAFWERAKSAASSRNGSPRSSFQITRNVSTDSMPQRAFTAKSTLASMFDGNLDFMRNNDTNGVAEQLFPDAFARPMTSFSSFTATEDSDAEVPADLDMEDFINVDDGSDSGTGTDEPTNSRPVSSQSELQMFSPFSTTPSFGRATLLDHFNQKPGVIGSFRRNQQFAKQLSSQSMNPAERASTHEFNALQKGRRGAANTPITPARKKRASQDLTPSRSSGVRKSMSSPLTGRRPRSRGGSLANADMLQTLGRNVFG